MTPIQIPEGPDTLRKIEKDLRTIADDAVPVIGPVAHTSLFNIFRSFADRVNHFHRVEWEVRRNLWLSHGHLGQYGDDGEMQCVECMPQWDYKRMDLREAVKQALYILKDFKYPTPKVGEEKKCLVCGHVKPWGIWDPRGVAVCADCRDKARTS